ncbi:MAG: ABC transporter [Deltaproteobacteria bacterium]|nr:MAG: ABC transporter [Deltaproteobacteria bacterium]
MVYWQLFCLEIRNILTNSAILMTVVGGLIFYSFLYPQPYLNQVPQEQKVAVLDNDNTPLSRRLIRMTDATPQVYISDAVGSRQEAEALLNNREVSGLLLIPENFSSDILKHRSPTLVYAGDASYFLVYGTIAEGITNAASALDADIRLRRQRLENGWQVSGVLLNSYPVFNPNTGYLNYVIPAVFVLILQQTLIIGSGIHGVTEQEQKDKRSDHLSTEVSSLGLLCTRLAAFLFIYTPFTLFYFGYCFTIYQITRFAEYSQMLSILLPFLLSVASLGCVLGKIIPRKELVTLVVLVSSIPLIFAAGFIWPKEAIPVWINWLVGWFPCTHAINAVYHLNQMGADFSEIRWELLSLWGLLGLYFVMALLLFRKK